jgi:anaerobic magnesium-protoporphyrin IX monomethyl ester cyclase
MHVLFLYLVPPKKFIPYGFSQGIGSLSALLKQHGHTTDLVYVEAFQPAQLRRTISPDVGLIAISATTDQMPLARQVIQFLSSTTTIPIVLGGVHATVAPDDAIQIPRLLGICRGEGEDALLELATALEHQTDICQIQNFWFRIEGTIIKNDVRPLIADLDALPFPDRAIFNYQQVINNNYDDGAEFMVGRGCPFHCAFCINPALHNLYRGKGRFVRYRSVEHVMAEISQVMRTYRNIQKLTFQDDILGLNLSWLAQFADQYVRAIGIPFRCNVRADCVNDETLSLLKAAGCAEIWVGVECGNDDLRNHILQKQVSTEQILAAFALIRKHQMKSKAYNMIGLPGETPEHIEETLQLNQRLQPDIKNVTIFRPYPGTALYDYCQERQWISNRTVSGYWEESILNQPALSREDTYFYQILFYYETLFPRLSKFVRRLNTIKIIRQLTLFRLLHPKWLLYRVYTLLKKWRRKS